MNSDALAGDWERLYRLTLAECDRERARADMLQQIVDSQRASINEAADRVTAVLAKVRGDVIPPRRSLA